MTPAEFVRTVRDIAPSVVELYGHGFSPDEAVEYRKHWECLPRAEPLVHDGPTNEIVDLIRNWDVSTLSITMVEFLPKPIKMDHALQVGFFEVDMLVILNDSQEVYVVDENVPTHLMWPVAESPGKCLDALACVARSMRAIRAVEVDDTADFEARRAAARQCASLAGGDKYYDFYTVCLDSEP